MEPAKRIEGGMVGLAVGDALGTTVEFMTAGGFTPLTDIIGGGKFNLLAGQWTDDTSMALCLSSSLLSKGGNFDPADHLKKYLKWYREGHLSSNGQCFDIGITVRTAVLEFEKSNERTSVGDQTRAGNGSLMRLAPVPLLYYKSPQLAVDLSGKSSLSTHGSQLAVDACRYFSGLLVGIMHGASKTEILSEKYSLIPGYWEAHPLAPEIESIAMGSFKSKNPPEIQTSGYVVHTLEAVLWAFYHTESFAEGCLKIVNLGDDADTTGAIYGQLAGVYYGVDAIPQNWREKIFFRELIVAMAKEITSLSEIVKSENGVESGYAVSKEYAILWDSFEQMESIHSKILKKVLPGPYAYKSVSDFDDDITKLKDEYLSSPPQGAAKEYLWNELTKIIKQEKDQVQQRTSRKPINFLFGAKK